MSDDQRQEGQSGYESHRATVLAQYYSLIGCLDAAREAGIIDGNSILDTRSVSGELSYEGLMNSIEEANQIATRKEEERQRKEDMETHHKVFGKGHDVENQVKLRREKRDKKLREMAERAEFVSTVESHSGNNFNRRNDKSVLDKLFKK